MKIETVRDATEEWDKIVKNPEQNKNASIDRIICNNEVIIIE